MLQSGSTAGLQIVDQQASGTGHDVALDEISILDVSPRLSQGFGAAEIDLRGSTTLTFTVTNTSELGAKSGFSFADNLPAGLQVAPVAQYSTTCGNAGSTGAKPQSKVLTFTGSLAEGRQSCSHVVRVSGTSKGAKTSSTRANVGCLVGMLAPDSATVTVR